MHTLPRSRGRLVRSSSPPRNRRHFTSLLRHGIRVLVSAELSAEIGLTRYRPRQSRRLEIWTTPN